MFMLAFMMHFKSEINNDDNLCILLCNPPYRVVTRTNPKIKYLLPQVLQKDFFNNKSLKYSI